MTFDETTKQKAEEFVRKIHEENGLITCDPSPKFSFSAGRESAKESLAIAVRALKFSCFCAPEAEGQMEKCDACDALALIRERGDLP